MVDWGGKKDRSQLTQSGEGTYGIHSSKRFRYRAGTAFVSQTPLADK